MTVTPTHEAHQAALTELRRLFPRGSTVWTLLRDAQPSSRSISVLGVDETDIREASYLVSRVLDLVLDDRWGGVTVNNPAGPDVGLFMVETLAQEIHGNLSALRHRWI